MKKLDTSFLSNLNDVSIFFGRTQFALYLAVYILNLFLYARGEMPTVFLKALLK